MFTAKDALILSEHVEMIYSRTVDDLLVNIAKHFKTTGWERTRFWEAKKLSELGKLTKESAKIIADNTGKLPEEIEGLFLEVAKKACKDIDPQLREAAEKGILTDPGTEVQTSPAMKRAIQSYIDQAVSDTNLVNATMLASTRESFTSTVTMIANEELQAEARAILETKTLEVVTNQETRVRAIRQAMNELAQKGLTGFIDAAGRHWSPEAYSAMVIRTTSHNAAVGAIRARQQEYGGGDIFQVSTHPGARPLCYPYQGKFFSWSEGPGTFTDGAGHEHGYDNISESSYGEPAGLFGINCGHHPIPTIPGFSFPQDGPEQGYEENKKEYQESQVQRQYEREIRQAKRELAVAEATGDQEAVKSAKQKVAQKQANMRSYIDQTGRPRRYDREQIGGTKDIEGYRGFMAQRNSDIPLEPTKPKAPDPEAEKILASLQNKGVKYYKVDDYAVTPAESEIIAKLAGGDMTAGSCSSLAFAYGANKNGMDVTDFRGGSSQDFFSRTYNIVNISKINGIDAVIHEVDREAKDCWKILQELPKDKEYYLAVGKHAAIVRNTETGVEYLEMQSRHEHINGWNPFEGNSRYSTPEVVLRKRFGCRKTIDKIKMSSGDMVFKKKVILMDVDTLKGDDFKKIMGYINTPVNEQKKGLSGNVK